MLRRLLDAVLRRPAPPPVPGRSGGPGRDRAAEREADRLDRLGPEGRAWEAASRQRDRDAHDGKDAAGPPGS